MDTKMKIAICCIIVFSIAFILYWMKKREQFTNTQTASMVLYYSPNCPHCHAFMPVWDKFVKSGIISAKKVDCTKETCNNVDGYPTVLMYKQNGKIVQFDKNRTVADLEAFVNENK